MRPEGRRGFALRWPDLWWLLAIPVYHMIATIRHEGSHLVVGLLQGGQVTDFSVFPSRRGWGHVNFDGGQVTWLMTAAPYVCDALTFFIGYVWLFRMSPRRRTLFVNVFAIALASSLIASLNNYRGAFYAQGGGDVGHLVRVLGPAPVHSFFLAAFGVYLIGIIRVLTKSPLALHNSWPSNPPVQPSASAVTPLAEQASRQPAGG